MMKLIGFLRQSLFALFYFLHFYYYFKLDYKPVFALQIVLCSFIKI